MALLAGHTRCRKNTAEGNHVDEQDEEEMSKAAARGFGEGSIAKRRDGRYEIRLSMGIDAVTGTRLRRFLYAKTQREAVRLLHDERSKLKNGRIGPRAAKTVEQFLEDWLVSVKQSRRFGTFTGYLSKIHLHINPVIGKVPLTALTRQHVDLVMDTARPKLKPSTLALLRVTLGTALAAAVKWELVDRNVVKLTEAPRVPHREQHFLDPAGAQRLLAVIAESDYAPIYLTMLTTGLRVGEALALRWSDVELDAGQLSVTHTLHRVDGEFQLLEPKTASSRRTIRLSAVTVAALCAHRAQQDIVTLDGSGLVFPSATGAPIEAGNVRRCFARLLKRAGFPKMRVHDLRHSWATIQLAMGTPAKVVQEQLGHSSIGTTMDTYSHVVPAMMQAAADAMDRALALPS